MNKVTRHEQLMLHLLGFYHPQDKRQLAEVIKASASIVMKELNASPDEIQEIIAGKMLNYAPDHTLETVEQVKHYASYFYQTIFLEMHEGVRAKLKSHLEQFIGGCYEVLLQREAIVPQMGRPSQGRAIRLQPMVTPEVAEWLEEKRIADGEKSVSDVVFKILLIVMEQS